MKHTKNDIYQSNYWYNDGLTKAKVHDLSGAKESLEKSLKFNEENINSRNLLGLVFYEEGEIAEAVLQWKKSSGIQSNENIADEYISEMQKEPEEVERMNSAVKKYNQCLEYCHQGGEDLALMQLKKLVSSNPRLLKAQQLLALLYLKAGQYAKARMILRQIHRLDTTNELTLRYLQVVKKLHDEKAAKLKVENQQIISRQPENESVLKSVADVLRDNSPRSSIINIIIGIVVGVAAACFLVLPAVNQAQSNKLNKEVVKYSDQMANKNAEISALTKELNGYKKASAELETVKKNAEEAKGSYDTLFEIYKTTRKSFNKEEVAVQLQSINKDALSDDGKKIYDDIYSRVVIPLCEKKYRAAQRSFKHHNYEETIPLSEFIISYDERYEGGNVLMMLAQSYEGVGRIDEAKTIYKKAVDLFPDTEIARDAGIALEGMPDQTEGTDAPQNIENNENVQNGDNIE